MSSNTKPTSDSSALPEAESGDAVEAPESQLPAIDRRRHRMDRRKNLDRRALNGKTYFGEPRRMTIDRRGSHHDRRQKKQT